jgi:hypothetical protein
MLIGFICYIAWDNFGYPEAIPTLIFALLCNISAYLLTDFYMNRKRYLQQQFE